MHLPSLRKFLSTALLCLPLAAQGHGSVPHRGSFVGTGSPVSVVTGNATLLGRFVGTGTVLAQTPTGIQGEFAWTGAHGDAITGTFVLTLTGMVEPGVFTFIETAQITSGTGRFANATGNALAAGTINVVTSEFSGRFDGWMTGIPASR
jgi:hypothetical protein